MKFKSDNTGDQLVELLKHLEDVNITVRLTTKKEYILGFLECQVPSMRYSIFEDTITIESDERDSDIYLILNKNNATSITEHEFVDDFDYWRTHFHITCKDGTEMIIIC